MNNCREKEVLTLRSTIYLMNFTRGYCRKRFRPEFHTMRPFSFEKFKSVAQKL